MGGYDPHGNLDSLVLSHWRETCHDERYSRVGQRVAYHHPVVSVVYGYESESGSFHDLLHVFREHLSIVAMYVRVDEGVGLLEPFCLWSFDPDDRIESTGHAEYVLGFNTVVVPTMNLSRIGLDNKVCYPCADTTKSDNRHTLLSYQTPPLHCFRQLVTKHIEGIWAWSRFPSRCGSAKEQRINLLDVIV